MCRGIEIRDDEGFEKLISSVRICYDTPEHEFADRQCSGGCYIGSLVIRFEGFEIDLRDSRSACYERGAVLCQNVGQNLEGGHLEGGVTFGEEVNE